MATYIAPNAFVDPHAEIDEDVWIGPFCTVGPDAKIGYGTRLENGVTLMGRVTLGRRNRLFPGAVIGGDPQDLTYEGGNTEVVIGDHNVIRECVTINRGSEKEEGVTTIGSHNFLMACSHGAHDWARARCRGHHHGHRHPQAQLVGRHQRGRGLRGPRARD